MPGRDSMPAIEASSLARVTSRERRRSFRDDLSEGVASSPRDAETAPRSSSEWTSPWLQAPALVSATSSPIRGAYSKGGASERVYEVMNALYQQPPPPPPPTPQARSQAKQHSPVRTPRAGLGDTNTLPQRHSFETKLSSDGIKSVPNVLFEAYGLDEATALVDEPQWSSGDLQQLNDESVRAPKEGSEESLEGVQRSKTTWNQAFEANAIEEKKTAKPEDKPKGVWRESNPMFEDFDSEPEVLEAVDQATDSPSASSSGARVEVVLDPSSSELSDMAGKVLPKDVIPESGIQEVKATAITSLDSATKANAERPKAKKKTTKKKASRQHSSWFSLLACLRPPTLPGPSRKQRKSKK